MRRKSQHPRQERRVTLRRHHATTSEEGDGVPGLGSRGAGGGQEHDLEVDPAAASLVAPLGNRQGSTARLALDAGKLAGRELDPSCHGLLAQDLSAGRLSCASLREEPSNMSHDAFEMAARSQ